MPRFITESEVEEVALEFLQGMGYEIIFGPEIAPAPEGTRPERETYSDVVLVGRLKRELKKSIQSCQTRLLILQLKRF